jgi:hypothetical protein
MQAADFTHNDYDTPEWEGEFLCICANGDNDYAFRIVTFDGNKWLDKTVIGWAPLMNELMLINYLKG